MPVRSALLIPLALALLAGALPVHATEPPAAPKAVTVPVEVEPAPDPAAFARILPVLHGEAEDAAALPSGEAPAKPVRLTGAAAKAEPLFAQAAVRREAGDAAGAKEALHQILALPRLDSRRTLRAWKALRDLGETPEPAVAGQVLGVVVELDYEVEGEHATLVVAGYAEGDPVLAASSGYSLLGVRLRARTVTAGRRLVTVAQPLLAEIPSEESRHLPASGQVRIALLTPGGVHAREMARKDLEVDATGLHSLYIAAQQLLAALRLESERL